MDTCTSVVPRHFVLPIPDVGRFNMASEPSAIIVRLCSTNGRRKLLGKSSRNTRDKLIRNES